MHISTMKRMCYLTGEMTMKNNYLYVYFFLSFFSLHTMAGDKLDAFGLTCSIGRGAKARRNLVIDGKTIITVDKNGNKVFYPGIVVKRTGKLNATDSTCSMFTGAEATKNIIVEESSTAQKRHEEKEQKTKFNFDSKKVLRIKNELGGIEVFVTEVQEVSVTAKGNFCNRLHFDDGSIFLGCQQCLEQKMGSSGWTMDKR